MTHQLVPSAPLARRRRGRLGVGDTKRSRWAAAPHRPPHGTDQRPRLGAPRLLRLGPRVRRWLRLDGQRRRAVPTGLDRLEAGPGDDPGCRRTARLGSPQSIAFGHGTLWVADHAGWLVKIDPTSFKVVARRRLDFGPLTASWSTAHHGRCWRSPTPATGSASSTPPTRAATGWRWTPRRAGGAVRRGDGLLPVRGRRPGHPHQPARARRHRHGHAVRGGAKRQRRQPGPAEAGAVPGRLRRRRRPRPLQPGKEVSTPTTATTPSCWPTSTAITGRIGGSGGSAHIAFSVSVRRARRHRNWTLERVVSEIDSHLGGAG